MQTVPSTMSSTRERLIPPVKSCQLIQNSWLKISTELWCSRKNPDLDQDLDSDSNSAVSRFGAGHSGQFPRLQKGDNNAYLTGFLSGSRKGMTVKTHRENQLSASESQIWIRTINPNR